VVVTKTFVWAHLPKTAGDTVATILGMFPEIIEYADPLKSRAKHTPFQKRPDLVAGRQRVLNIRRLPSWQLSYSMHKSRNGVEPDLVPGPMDSAEEMVASTTANRILSNHTDAGTVWPDRWIRVEHLVDDVLALLDEHVEVTPKKRKKIQEMKPKNEGRKYDRSPSAWFTDEMISRMYENNPLWQRAEQLAYSNPAPLASTGGNHQW
jgi:tellurite resistance-related uncharacterized protein